MNTMIRLNQFHNLDLCCKIIASILRQLNDCAKMPLITFCINEFLCKKKIELKSRRGRFVIFKDRKYNKEYKKEKLLLTSIIKHKKGVMFNM